MKRVSKIDIDILSKKTNKRFEQFVEDNSDRHFYQIQLEAVDYYSASFLARGKIQKALDILYVATDEDIFNIQQTCFVVGSNRPEKAKSQDLNYKLDGHFVPNWSTYNQFLNRYKQIKIEEVETVSIKKIYATLRYLRLGTLSSEQEHKLLNYWIGIEYLFSASNSEESKTSRLHEYYKKIHSNSYIRRQFKDLNNSIRKLKIENSLTLFSDDNLSYLLTPTTEAEIETFKNRYPLLYYRFHTLKSKYADPLKIKKDIERHNKNLDWNLTRIYRTRNEIVHSAATDLDVIELAAHSKYYLVFTLNALIDFILHSPMDINMDHKTSIDDFFTLEALKFDSNMINKTIKVEDFLSVINPVEYLQS